MQGAGATEATCWRCGGAAAALVCPACEAPQPVPPDADLFAVLGLPRDLRVDAADLERRWHAASRAIHPDRHQTAGGRARELSLAASAAVNRAYRTLREPVARGRYWLELHGQRLGHDNNRVPPALAALVFETQETLEALRGGADVAAEVRAVRDQLAARLRALGDDLVARYAAWGADAATPAALAELKTRLSEIAYLRTLLGDVDAALGD